MSLPATVRPGREWGRIGLLGGSFNPAHIGHLHLSKIALKRLGLDAIWWLVSPQNPLKSSAGMASLRDRMASARNVARHPAIYVTDLEREFGSTFTAITLKRMQRRFPRAQFVWLMGADNMLQIPLWKRWDQIFDTVPVAVVARPAYSWNSLHGKAATRFRRARVSDSKASKLAGKNAPAWIYIASRLEPTSATDIRAGKQTPYGGTKVY
jgi:nicotinate-nucleotide adenylyltransferase